MNYLWVIICQSIVGSSYPIVQEAMDSIPEFVFACITLGIASLLLMPIASKLEHTKWTSLGKSNWVKLSVQSLCVNVLYSVFLFFALTHASAAVSGIFTGLAPAVVFLIAPLMIKEKLTLKKGLSIAVAAAAAIIVSVSSEDGGTDIFGLIFLILSVLSVSVFTVLSKKFSVDLKPITAAAGICFTGFVITIPFCVIQSITSGFDYTQFFDGKIMAETIYYAVFVWAVAYVLWYLAIPKVSATFGGVGLAIVPIASVVSSIAIYNNPIRTVDIIGLVLITLSIVLSVYAEKTTAAATAKAKEEIETENMVSI